MPITSQVSNDRNEVEICIKGRFDFSTHRDFRNAFNETDVNIDKAKFVINLRDAEYMDSSALGMLLLLRERAGGQNANILLKGCSEQIKQILSVSNFQKLFKIQ